MAEKTKTCPACKMEVPADAMICGHCRATVSTGLAATQLVLTGIGGVGCLIWVGAILLVVCAVLFR